MNEKLDRDDISPELAPMVGVLTRSFPNGVAVKWTPIIGPRASDS